MYGNGNSASNTIAFLHDPDRASTSLTTTTLLGAPTNIIRPFTLTFSEDVGPLVLSIVNTINCSAHNLTVESPVVPQPRLSPTVSPEPRLA